MDARKVIERLSEWISRKTAENETTLESYLIGGEDRVVLLGGYVLERAGEGQKGTVDVLELIVGPEYEQMELLEARKCSEMS